MSLISPNKVIKLEKYVIPMDLTVRSTFIEVESKHLLATGSMDKEFPGQINVGNAAYCTSL